MQGVGDVPVPDGWFRSARRDGKSRREDDLPKSVVAKRLSQAPMEGVLPTAESATSLGVSPSCTAPMYKHFPTSPEESHLDGSEVPVGRKIAYSLPSSVAHTPCNSTGIRQTTYSVPNHLASHPRLVHPPTLPYREPPVVSVTGLAPAPASASVSPSTMLSPPVFVQGLLCPSSPSVSASSSSTPATPSPRMDAHHLPERLVPLEYLQSLPHPRRLRMDEELLQRFSGHGGAVKGTRVVVQPLVCERSPLRQT